MTTTANDSLLHELQSKLGISVTGQFSGVAIATPPDEASFDVLSFLVSTKPGSSIFVTFFVRRVSLRIIIEFFPISWIRAFNDISRDLSPFTLMFIILIELKKTKLLEYLEDLHQE